MISEWEELVAQSGFKTSEGLRSGEGNLSSYGDFLENNLSITM
ncbi:hypothetical protein [Coxiella endosymbiont of Ornithodoros amblus]|nr:hypothetical protein [Coxiella endosymbiont of Ornithodoros amblus]